jgi:hypothetical protein
MIYAKRVSSPLKGGVEAELGEKTLLLGGNGKGKTAVLQALKLGTKGYVDDQEGKDGVANTASLSRLFPAGGDLWSVVEMSDGTKFSWKSERKKRGGFTKPKASQPYAVRFPFHGLKALLSGDDKKIRAWLEDKVASSLTEEELLALLPGAQRDEGRKALAIFPQRAPSELAEKMKGEARNLRAASTRKEKTIETLVEGIPLPLSAAQRETAEKEMQRLWAEANAENVMSPTEHAQLRQSIETLAHVLTQAETRISELPEAKEGEAETLKAVSRARGLVVAHMESFGHEVCHVCLNQKADIKHAYKQWDDALGKLGGSQSRQRLQGQYDDGMTEVQGLAARYKTALVVDLPALMAEHGAISSRLGQDSTNSRVWNQAEALKGEIAGARASADIFSSLSKTWEKEGRLLLESRKQEFEDSVTAWLPAGEVFSVDLGAGRVGLLRGEQVFTSLSGAEHSRVLLAVLSAEGAGQADSTPSILEPEDRGWDSDTLADVMTALTSAPDQVILMSTVPPTGMEYSPKGLLVGEPPEGWKVVEVGT